MNNLKWEIILNADNLDKVDDINNSAKVFLFVSGGNDGVVNTSHGHRTATTIEPLQRTRWSIEKGEKIRKLWRHSQLHPNKNSHFRSSGVNALIC